MYLCTQGSISGFALISPWALKKCRAYGTQSSHKSITHHHTPHSHLTTRPLKFNNTPILAMNPERAALLTREINTRAVVPLLKELILRFVSVYPGFHFGLCPHFTLVFEEVSCLRHSALPPLQVNHTPPHTHSNLTIHTIPISTTHTLKFNNTSIPILTTYTIRI